MMIIILIVIHVIIETIQYLRYFVISRSIPFCQFQFHSIPISHQIYQFQLNSKFINSDLMFYLQFFTMSRYSEYLFQVVYIPSRIVMEEIFLIFLQQTSIPNLSIPFKDFLCWCLINLADCIYGNSIVSSHHHLKAHLFRLAYPS